MDIHAYMVYMNVGYNITVHHGKPRGYRPVLDSRRSFAVNQKSKRLSCLPGCPRDHREKPCKSFVSMDSYIHIPFYLATNLWYQRITCSLCMRNSSFPLSASAGFPLYFLPAGWQSNQFPFPFFLLKVYPQVHAFMYEVLWGYIGICYSQILLLSIHILSLSMLNLAKSGATYSIKISNYIVWIRGKREDLEEKSILTIKQKKKKRIRKVNYIINDKYSVSYIFILDFIYFFIIIYYVKCGKKSYSLLMLMERRGKFQLAHPSGY